MFFLFGRSELIVPRLARDLAKGGTREVATCLGAS